MIELIESKSYLVGGSVRDKLQNIKSFDLDYVVVGATEKEMLDAGFSKVGKDFPVFLHPKTGDEYALARKEKNTGPSYHDFEFEVDNISLEEDLSRRDLTINSMAMDKDGTIIDPFGGQKDLKEKILRHTTDAFCEDPVRIFRLARFYTRFKSFTVSNETNKLVKKMVKDNLCSSMKGERILLELKKAFLEENVDRFFRLLKDQKILEDVFSEFFHLTDSGFEFFCNELLSARKSTDNFDVILVSGLKVLKKTCQASFLLRLKCSNSLKKLLKVSQSFFEYLHSDQTPEDTYQLLVRLSFKSKNFNINNLKIIYKDQLELIHFIENLREKLCKVELKSKISESITKEKVTEVFIKEIEKYKN